MTPPAIPPEGNIRIDEDIVLTNVLSFDVKVWDPGAPVFALVVDNVAPVGEPEEVLQVIAPGDPSYVGEYLVRWRDGTMNANLPANPPGLNRMIYRYGAYVDLNYMCLLGPPNPIPAGETIDTVDPNYVPLPDAPVPQFHGAGNYNSQLRGTNPYPKDFSSPAAIASDWPPALNSGNATAEKIWPAAVYDTGSIHYENDGDDQDGVLGIDQATNGLDDSNPPAIPAEGGPDDVTELEVPPPYPSALRSIQIKIRTFEPDSRQIREVTLVHEFLAE